MASRFWKNILSLLFKKYINLVDFTPLYIPRKKENMKQSHHHKQILQIALPSIISNITVPLLGLVDLAIVGHLGSPSYIGAIAIGGTIFNMIYWIFAFLRMGTSGMTSQAYGAQNNEEVNNLLYRSLSSSFIIAFFVILFKNPILTLSIYVLSPPPSVLKLATDYYDVCIWGAPAVFGLYSLTGWFIGLQKAKFPLYVAIVQNIINIGASVFLVFIMNTSIKGVATGTVIAQYCGFALSVYFAHRLYKTFKPANGVIFKQVFNPQAIRVFFGINRDIFLRTLCLVCVTLYFTSAGAKQGEVILAVNTLLMQYFTFYSFFMDGLAFAGEALAGQCAGAKDDKKLKTVVRDLFIWCSAVALVFTSFYGIAGYNLLSLLTDEIQVRLQANNYLPWAVGIPFAGLAAFTWDGIFIGLTATRYMLLSMFAATLLFFMVFYYTSPYMGNHALWLAFLLYLITRGTVQHILYYNRIINNNTLHH